MTARESYDAEDVARMLRISRTQLYKTRRRRELIDGMPRPIGTKSKHVWDKASFDAWYTRHHPHAPRLQAVNDNVTAPATGALQRAFLHQHYSERAKP